MTSTKLSDELLFVQTQSLMFNVNSVQGLEFRTYNNTLIIVYKNGHYLSKSSSQEEFIKISEQFMSLIELSENLNQTDYVVFMNVIFTVKRLVSIEYRGPSQGFRHLISFKDGQYLHPNMDLENFKILYQKTLDAINTNVIEDKKGI